METKEARDAFVTGSLMAMGAVVRSLIAKGVIADHEIGAALQQLEDDVGSDEETQPNEELRQLSILPARFLRLIITEFPEGTLPSTAALDDLLTPPHT